MLQFPQQQLPLPFAAPLFGDILHREQNPLFVIDAPGIEQHHLRADLRKIVLDLKVVKRVAFRQDLFEQFPKQNTLYNSGEPGIGIDAAKWLSSQKVVAVGADTWAVEVIPGEDPTILFPIHQHLITDNGIHIIENVKTDDIAEEAANTKRATFFVNMTVPKAVGLTGNFVGIEAIR